MIINNNKSVSRTLLREYRLKRTRATTNQRYVYNKDLRLSSFSLTRDFGDVIIPFIDIGSKSFHPIIRIDESIVNVEKIILPNKVFIKINYFYTPYLTHLYKTKDWDGLSDYIYLLYRDCDYFMRMHYMRLCDHMFSMVFLRCGCEKNDFFKNLFVERYNDLLVNTILKMRRVSFHKFNADKANEITFTSKSFVQVFLSGWIDIVKRINVDHRVMTRATDYFATIEKPSDNFTYEHGFDLLLDLSTNQ